MFAYFQKNDSDFSLVFKVSTMDSLTPEYIQLVKRNNIIDEVQKAFDEENCWTDELCPFFSLVSDPTTLDTIEKRQRFYDTYIEKHYNKLRRQGRCGHYVKVHHNIILAKVEHWIRTSTN